MPPETDPSSPLPDFTRTSEIDRVLERADTHGVSRKDFLRLATAGAAMLGAASLLAACGSSSSSAGSSTAAGTTGAGLVGDAKGKLAFLIMTNQLQYDVQMNDAAKQVASGFGYGYSGLDGRLDAQLQLNQFQQSIGGGANAILLHSPDGSNVRQIATDAQKNQAYLANVWGTLPWFTPFEAGDYWTLYAQPDEFLVQGKITRTLADALGGKGTIVRVSGVPGNTADTIRSAGADAVLKDYLGIKLAGELPGKWNAEDSQKAMESLLSRYPDVQGVIAQNDDIATGVIAALNGAGKTPGKDVLVTGADGTDLAAQRIKQGTQLGTTANVPAYAGYLLVSRLHDVLNGWKPRDAERMLQWESVILTKDNVDPYIARYVGSPSKPPFNAKLLSHVEAGDKWDPQFLLYPMADLDTLWTNIRKPSGWQPPPAFAAATSSGEFKKVADEYKAAYKADVLGPSPA